MSNGLILYPNRIPGATLSGGAWDGAQPLSNIQDPDLGVRAWTTDDDPASSLFVADLGRSLLMRGLFILSHNVRTTGLVKLEASNAGDFSSPILLVDWRAAWMSAGADERDWEAADWPTGKPRPEYLAGWRWPIVVPFPAGAAARYWRVSLDDHGNPDGRIKIGGAFLAGGIRPGLNFAKGAAIGWQHDTDVVTSTGGTRYFRRRSARRVTRFSFDAASEDEGFARHLELQRMAGLDHDIGFIANPDDPNHLQRRSLVGNARALGEIEQVQFQLTTASYQIEERL
ncbi:MAG: hypothetical protein AB7O45_02385 [Alphaproteobacteria bacterium]